MNRVIKACKLSGGQMLEIVKGDLTEENVDAIVNAANNRLRHGGGVAGAIARRGGNQIQAESDAWVREHGPVGHAEPAITRAGRLPCRYVIHAVGPIWGAGDEDAKLSAAVRGSLRLAEETGLESIALPAISTGIFGFPRCRAARIILQSIRSYFQATGVASPLKPSQPATLRQIRLVLYEQASLDDFLTVWEELDICQPANDSI